MKITVEPIKEITGLYGKKCLSVYVKVEIEPKKVYQYGFTRYPDEENWLCDSQFGPGCLPIFAHGEGSRCCRKHVAAGQLKDKIQEEYIKYLAENKK